MRRAIPHPPALVIPLLITAALATSGCDKEKDASKSHTPTLPPAAVVVAEAVSGIIHAGWKLGEALSLAEDSARGKHWFTGSI